MSTYIDYLSDPGLGLIREIRDPQIQMAKSVNDALLLGGIYFVEAGTGVGKGYAYLTPALLTPGRRIVVATAKKQLQDQLTFKDLPALANAIGRTNMKPLLRDRAGNPQILVTALKGKANYACPLQAEDHSPDVAYRSFLNRSTYGDRADYNGQVPMWWNRATAEECIGPSCELAKHCGYIRLKQAVTMSRVVIINHHLLGSDIYYGQGKLVGGPFDVLIVDEAHKLAEGIRSAFTVKVTEKSIEQLAHLHCRPNAPWPFPQITALQAPWADMFNSLPNRHWREMHVRDIPVFNNPEEVLEGLEEVNASFTSVLTRYHAEDGNFAEVNAHNDIIKALMTLLQSQRKVESLLRGIQTMQGIIKPLDAEEPEDYQIRKERILTNTVTYGLVDFSGFQIHCAPVNLGGIAKNYIKTIRTLVMTSATLAVGNNFDHLEDVIGVPPQKAEVLATTFDYETQGFLYVPKDVPYASRGNPDYIQQMKDRVKRAVYLCRLSNGGAFILTTANDELDEFGNQLKAAFPGRVFVQGHAKSGWDGDPPTVLQAYLRTPNSILVGSKSFWEGVDVVGEQLRLVIIAKLPFPPFNDPLVKARERIAGADSFKRVQMVDMLTDLRQGIGRLIRSKRDRGMVAILDSRLCQKPYGKLVLSVLKFPVTYNLGDCEKYLPLIVKYFQHLATK